VIPRRYAGGRNRMTVNEKTESNREKVRRLLRELFQFDAQDLDFGIYRILNFRRKEIERFIDEDLMKAVEAEFKEYAKVGMVELQKDVDNLRPRLTMTLVKVPSMSKVMSESMRILLRSRII
jgi:adenine-specific DNA-methyltransferase